MRTRSQRIALTTDGESTWVTTDGESTWALVSCSDGEIIEVHSQVEKSKSRQDSE